MKHLYTLIEMCTHATITKGNELNLIQKLNAAKHCIKTAETAHSKISSNSAYRNSDITHEKHV